MKGHAVEVGDGLIDGGGRCSKEMVRYFVIFQDYQLVFDSPKEPFLEYRLY